MILELKTSAAMLTAGTFGVFATAFLVINSFDRRSAASKAISVLGVTTP